MCVDVLKLARELPLAEERYWYGDLSLIARPAAAILNSRQGRHSHGGEEWVRSTINAVSRIMNDGKVLLTSTGLITWELTAWAAAESLHNVVLLVPMAEGTIPEDVPLQLQRVFEDYGLTRQNALAIPFFVPSRGSEKLLWKARDGLILRNAETLIPVSIREGGFLESCLRDPRIIDKINADFQVKYSPYSQPVTTIPRPEQVREALADLEWDHVAHWTRQSNGPWPGEKRVEFYRDLDAARDTGYRSARLTLLRMLREESIRATSWRMPMNLDMVSLSELPPWDMVERMSWRKRYVRMNYEPWGIAVKCSALQGLGARKVVYGNLEQRKQLPLADRPYYQQVSDHSDWENEREWRLRGDLDLSELADNEVMVLVPDATSAQELQSSCRFDVLSIT